MPQAPVSAARPAPWYWRLQLAGWTIYGLTGVALFVAFAPYSAYIFPIELVIVAVLLPTSHLLRHLIRRYGWLNLPVPALLGRLALTNLALAVGSQVFINLVIYYLIRPPYLGGLKAPELQFVGYVLNTYSVFWLWTALYLGLHYLRGYRQAEIDKWKLTAAVREAEMRTLKAQINPHFMFNGLNNIRALVMEDPARARAMITHLSDLLRYSIQLNSTEQVPLARELEIVEHYLQLEAIQLEERLSYSLDVDPAALLVLIPPMTVQLLVENAIKHGLAPRPEGGSIQLTAQLNDSNTLHLNVRNTGHYAPASGQQPGVGLRNARERLALLFGPAAHLHLSNDPHSANTVVAHLQLPVGIRD